MAEDGKLSWDDAGDQDRREWLTMTIASANVFASAELLNDDLLGSELIDNLADHTSAGDCGRADRGVAVFSRYQQDV